MGKLVQPKVYLVGYTAINLDGLHTYLRDTNNEDFLQHISDGKAQGLSDGEILTSFYAKLCYKSLTLDKNKNITRIRDIQGNLENTHDQGHGSVWEHVMLNFVITNCSRVFTHELVRHRAGTAFSQTSGRYVRGDEVDLVFDPILEPVRGYVQDLLVVIETHYRQMVKKMGLDEMTNFDQKKAVTSALRRVLPNGQSNEIGFSLNLRALRHIIQVRTARGAEWEIRLVFNQVYHLVKDIYPLLFYGAKEETVKGLLEISGMKTQPYTL